MISEGQQGERLTGIFQDVAIQVDDYDDRWPVLADAACRELTDALPGIFTVIEHIGSTAVPGLAAKAIIDLMAAVPTLGTMAAQEGMLASLGYQRYETGMPNRLFYFRNRGSRRTHHLHVVTIDTWPSRNERVLRDYLRSHPKEAARYAERKRQLLSADVDADSYTRAKTAVIQELTDRARTERGLPLSPVWEE
ncbi:GrpB family protein [Rugosimonospora africana]|uniref:GrpB family protein n=1 Tax=Rugosimonospora africana TaxID=556532 RepID=A0A8J3VWT3_9ACTN|nr:GrpB family protein [Rugosimonospora africana]GIH21176.1 hypothetical protein Raf01_93480 [Rugosimonospora africana]